MIPPISTTSCPLFLGFELSIETLTAVVLDGDLQAVGFVSIRLDDVLPQLHLSHLGGWGRRAQFSLVDLVRRPFIVPLDYAGCVAPRTPDTLFTDRLSGGVHHLNNSDGEVAIHVPVEVWIKALDEVMLRLREQFDLSRVVAISGAAMTMTVWLTREFPQLLSRVSPHLSLHSQLPSDEIFSVPSPLSALDSSSLPEIRYLEKNFPPNVLAAKVGSRANYSRSSIHIMRIKHEDPEAYDAAGWVGSAGAFMFSLLCENDGTQFGIEDEGAAVEMGLWNINQSCWDRDVIKVVTGGRDDDVPALVEKLGQVQKDGGNASGKISAYFIYRYGFSGNCIVAPWTTDQLATYLYFLPKQTDAVLSLSTHLDFLLTPINSTYRPSHAYTLYPHPAQKETDEKTFVASLSSRNAGVARSFFRDVYANANWSVFHQLCDVVAPGGSIGLDDKLFLFAWSEGEIRPHGVVKGILKFEHGVRQPEFGDLRANPRCLLENQFMSFRIRYSKLVAFAFTSLGSSDDVYPPKRTALGLGFQPFSTKKLPRRLCVAGGPINNPSVIKILADVFNSEIYVPSAQLTSSITNPSLGFSAPALGSAYKAHWAWRRSSSCTAEEVGSFEEDTSAVLTHRHYLHNQHQSLQPDKRPEVGKTRYSSGLVQQLSPSQLNSFTNTSHYTSEASGNSTEETFSGHSSTTSVDLVDDKEESETKLVLVTPMETGDAELVQGLVKVGEGDVDTFKAYSSTIPEFARLEELVLKGLSVST